MPTTRRVNRFVGCERSSPSPLVPCFVQRSSGLHPAEINPWLCNQCKPGSPCHACSARGAVVHRALPAGLTWAPFTKKQIASAQGQLIALCQRMWSYVLRFPGGRTPRHSLRGKEISTKFIGSAGMQACKTSAARGILRRSGESTSLPSPSRISRAAFLLSTESSLCFFQRSSLLRTSQLKIS